MYKRPRKCSLRGKKKPERSEALQFLWQLALMGKRTERELQRHAEITV